jgi:hypothetical protein
MRLAAVSLDAWAQLEDQLAHRYGKSPWRARAIMKNLLTFAYWRIPKAQETREQTGGRSRAALERHRLEAAAELNMMASLPRLTGSDELALLEHRARFGFQVEIVRAADRHLSFFHLWALCDRRRAADLVVETVGGAFIVPLAVLEEERARRQDEDAVELMQLHAERDRVVARSPGGGMQAVFFTF